MLVVISFVTVMGAHYSIITNPRFIVRTDDNSITLIHDSLAGIITRQNIESFSVKPLDDYKRKDN